MMENNNLLLYKLLCKDINALKSKNKALTTDIHILEMLFKHTQQELKDLKVLGREQLTLTSTEEKTAMEHKIQKLQKEVKQLSRRVQHFKAAQVNYNAEQLEIPFLKQQKHDAQKEIIDLKVQLKQETDSLRVQNETLQNSLVQANKTLQELKIIEQKGCEMNEENVSAHFQALKQEVVELKKKLHYSEETVTQQSRALKEQDQKLQGVLQDCKDLEHKFGEMEKENVSLHQQIKGQDKLTDHLKRQVCTIEESLAKKEEFLQEKAQELEKVWKEFRVLQGKYDRINLENNSLHLQTQALEDLLDQAQKQLSEGQETSGRKDEALHQKTLELQNVLEELTTLKCKYDVTDREIESLHQENQALRTQLDLVTNKSKSSRKFWNIFKRA